MEWYVKLVFYFISLFIATIALYQVDFNKFIRIGHKHFATLVYVVLSLALGYLIASLFIGLGDLIALNLHS